MRAVILFIVLMAIWLILSGHYTPLLVGLGVVSALFCVWMSQRLDSTDAEGLPLHLLLRLPFFWFWLIGQILLANIQMIRIILTGAHVPRLFRVDAENLSQAALVLYANSITLTPGTVTVEAEKGALLVHALSKSMADDIKNGGMLTRVRLVDGGDG